MPKKVHNPNSEIRTAVALTGIGMISPLGVTAPECWEKMLQGRSGIRAITKFDASECATRIGGQLPESYDRMEKERTSKRLFKQTVRATRIGRMCAQEAFKDSAIDPEELDPFRAGVIFGSSGSSVRSPEDAGGRGTERFKVIREMVNAIPSWISLDYGLKGPSFILSAACSSGSYAIATACDLIRRGTIDLAITGGVDSLLTKNNIVRGNAAQVLWEQNGEPEKAMRPFDGKRAGYVLSDGGCAMVLESHEHAVKRNARVYAWIKGDGSLSEAYSIGSPSPDGKSMAQCMEMALDKADVSRERIGYISANGISMVTRDLCETTAIKEVFRERANDLLVSSQKSMIGHTVGASGAIALAAAALAIKTRMIPPTINYEHPDPACDLNYVPNEMVTTTDLDAALVNSFAFGGHNSAIVLTRSP